ncbi:DUF1559 domain-containing protein [Blastopirellula marina]|uniref:DUF1559 domain-containing protein n=1 Tax=Blastopirellula marina TaxID=124 RepID=A0A2S8FHY9_9BACT|nr:DUF1559 domain-containing protein [Blastopirellula marina]PQO31751.1 hypothetical protein C5Y98_20275 [Blastopirellula marina]PTL43058.1 DUF1559 domain-containing protein [Blastopirellula marina]
MTSEPNPFDSQNTKRQEPVVGKKPTNRVIEMFVVVGVVVLLIAILLPAVQRAREMTASRLSNNRGLKSIGLALHNYHEIYGVLPPAYVTDENGKPLYSWRVLLLPLLEEEQLYAEFELDKAWNEGHNRTLIERMPAVYRHHESFETPTGGQTRLLALVDEVEGRTMFLPGQSRSFGQFSRELDQCALAIDHPDFSCTWSEPRDVAPRDLLRRKGFVWPGPQESGVYLMFGDSSVRRIEQEDWGHLKEWACPSVRSNKES